MKDRISLLYPGGFFHVYNRANGDEVMFRNEENYEYFIRHYDLYISPIAKTCAYCLMPNHFHFIVQIRSNAEVIYNLDQRSIMNRLFEESPKYYHNKMSLILSHQFSHLFNSYAQSYNKMYKRKGSLFMRNYKRINIQSDTYFRDLVVYIHSNPVKSNLSQRPEDWKFSSYNACISKKQTFVDVEMTLDFFNDLDNFIFVHQKTLQGL